MAYRAPYTKKKKDETPIRNWRKLFDYTSGGKGVSIQWQGTRTSISATFGEFPSDIMQISGSERRD